MTLDQKETASASSQVAGSDRRFFARLLLSVAPVALLGGGGVQAQNLPTGGTTVAGTVNIATPSATQMNINQGSQAAVVNWNSFDVGQGARVDIAQPNAQATLLNRVTGGTTSSIHGQINANGQVFVVNPNGIFIGPTGRINSSGFVASTLDMGTDDFMAGRYRFEGSGNSASVENAGRIETVPGGYAALIGGKVKNSGVIRVPLGKVGLAAGEQVTLDFTGDGFLQVAVPSDGDDTMEALVENSGLIEANGGQVQLLAASARDAARQVVNMSGVIEARSVSGRNGAVVLGGSGGAVRVSGRIDTSAQITLVESSPRPVARPVSGGTITITGEAVTLAGATLDASGAGAGDGGLIRVGGDFKGGGDVQRAMTAFVDAASRLTADGGETGDGGRIVVWSDLFTEFNGRNSARGGDRAGDGGFVEVSGRDDLRYRGLTDTRAPQGQTGMLLLDPGNITVGNDAGDTFTPGDVVTNIELTSITLDTTVDGDGAPGNITINEAIAWSSFSTFSLNADNNVILNAAITGPNGTFEIDAGGTITTGTGGTVDVNTFVLNTGSWQQVGATLPSFSATDFQLGSAANFLRATGGNGTSAPYQLTDVYGLQGIGGPSLSSMNFILVNDIDASGTGSWNNPNDEGPILGWNSIDFAGTLDGDGFAIDGLTKNDPLFAQGGLFNTLAGSAQILDLGITNASIGTLGGGILATSNAGLVQSTSVEGTLTTVAPGTPQTGGMVGTNSGTIQDSFTTATVTANGLGDEAYDVGGLAGLNTGTINRSHATGAVNAEEVGGGTLSVGGLVGRNTGTVSNSYATGAPTAITMGGTAVAGGLVGTHSGGAVQFSYSTGAPSTGPGVTTGGLIGTGAGPVTASYWDSDSSGQSTSAGGTALTTAELQDTNGFFALTSPLGWDYANSWAPGTSSQYPLNLTTSPVVFAQPDALTLQYGDTIDASGTGTLSGGASVYVFGPDGDTLDTSGVFSNLFFSDEDVGNTTYVPSTTELTSTGDVSYQVISLEGDAEITPAPLTITALGQSRTYGDDFALDSDAFEVDGLVEEFEDSLNSVILTSDGEDLFAPVADSPYDILVGEVQGNGLSNYTITRVSGELTIDPAALTVTANGQQNRVYGDDFSFAGTEFSASGFVPEDSASITSVTLSSAGAAQFANVADGPYDITPSAAVGTGLENYTITYVDAVDGLTITPAALTITPDDITRTYGDNFAFTGTEFSTNIDLGPNSISSVDLISSGDEQFATASFYLIRAEDAVGTGLENYEISYDFGFLEVERAPLTLRPLDQIKMEGEELVFSGTEFTATGLVNPEDSVDFVELVSDGAPAEAEARAEPYDIIIIPNDDEGEGEGEGNGDGPILAFVSGSGLFNYEITYETGNLVVFNESSVIDPPPVPTIEVTPTVDTEIETEGGGGGGTAITPAQTAAETLGTVEDLSTDFQDEASGCASEDVTEYLACLSDAMDTYAEDLDAIAQGLPPGLETIGDIIKGASAGVRAAGEKAQARLALATTAAERAQIRREAIQEARAAIRTAQTEIRKAITLIRAEDPELVSLQRDQVETIVAAVGSADIGLSRVVEL